MLQSTVTINKWLGVEEYKLSLEVEDYKVLDNNEVFEEELKDSIELNSLESLLSKK